MHCAVPSFAEIQEQERKRVASIAPPPPATPSGPPPTWSHAPPRASVMAERGQPDRGRVQEPQKKAAQPVAPFKAAAPRTAAQKLAAPKASRPAVAKPAEVRLSMQARCFASVWLLSGSGPLAKSILLCQIMLYAVISPP